jgi:alanyl-tRNA synthetase
MNKKSIVDIKLSPKLFSKNNNLMYFSVFEQNQKNIISALKELQNENSNLIFICFNIFPNKIQYIINCKPDSSIKANELIKKINIISNGNGGGDMFFAQGGSDKKDSLSDIIQLISDY